MSNNKNLYLKATVTGKRQITIPKEICELLNIDNGKQVVFRTEGNKVIFETEKEYETCFACFGTAKIGEKECFVCKGTGKLEKDIISDIYKLVGVLSIHSIKYGVEIDFIQQEIDNNGNFSYKEFPVIKLRSVKYLADELLRIQDEIQKLIIEQFSPKSTENKTLFYLPSDTMLNLILDTLSTEKAKEEVRRWFRYERTNWN